MSSLSSFKDLQNEEAKFDYIIASPMSPTEHLKNVWCKLQPPCGPTLSVNTQAQWDYLVIVYIVYNVLCIHFLQPCSEKRGGECL